MRLYAVFISGLLLSEMVCSAFALPQTDSHETIHVDATRVELQVTVRNKQTKADITGLTAKNFIVDSDGEAVSITHFSEGTETNFPHALYLFIREDSNDRKVLRSSVAGMEQALLTLPADAAIALGCYDSHRAVLVTQLTTQRDVISTALEAMSSAANGGTYCGGRYSAKKNDGVLSSSSDNLTAKQSAPPFVAEKVNVTKTESALKESIELAAASWEKRKTHSGQPVFIAITGRYNYGLPVEQSIELHNLLLRDQFTFDAVEQSRGKQDDFWHQFTQVTNPVDGLSIIPTYAAVRTGLTEYLASATGGEVVMTSSSKYSDTLIALLRSIRNSYSVEFAPPTQVPDNKLHKIIVRLVPASLSIQGCCKLYYRDHYYFSGEATVGSTRRASK